MVRGDAGGMRTSNPTDCSWLMALFSRACVWFWLHFERLYEYVCDLQLCPSASCAQPLDVSNNATFETIEAVLKDLFTVLPDEYVHLGGDEVTTSCWNNTQRINDWMAAKGLTPDGVSLQSNL